MKLLALAVVLAAGCASKPPVILGERMPHGCTGNKIADDERCLGWLMDKLWTATSMRPYRDAAVNAYVASVGNRLVRAHGDHRAWTFAVIDNEDVNAFAGIGTHVYINRGILLAVRSEDELAAVISHEIGHALGGHTHAAMITSQTWREKRDDEIQADETGVMLLAEAGYDVRAMPLMMRALAAGDLGPSAAEKPDEHGNYPPWIERISRAEIAVVRYARPARVTGGDARFAKAMARLVVGIDPRDHAMIGTTATFANEVAIDVPEETHLDNSTGSLTFSLFMPDLHVADLRLMDHAVTLSMGGPNKDGSETAVVRGRRDSSFGRQLDLVITINGPNHVALLRTLVARVRPLTRDELAAIHPVYANINAPRALWSPPALVSAE